MAHSGTVINLLPPLLVSVLFAKVKTGGKSCKQTNAVAWLTWQCVLYVILQPEGEDDLKKRQLMELAIINGTYRDTKSGQSPPGTAGTPTATATSLPQPTATRKFGRPQVDWGLSRIQPWRAACWYCTKSTVIYSFGSCCDVVTTTCHPFTLRFHFLVFLHCPINHYYPYT